MKQFLAVICGVVVAGIVISGIELIGHKVFPLPADIDPTDLEMLKASADRIPVGAKLAVCIAWAVGTLAGCFAATLVVQPGDEAGGWAPFRPAFVISQLLMGAAVMNLVTIPSPVWMWVLGLAVFLPCGMMGWYLANDVSSLRLQQHMAASPQRVFQYAADFPNAAATISGITKVEMLTEGDIGVGTRFRETRLMFGREAVEEMEVTAFSPGSSYTVEADSCGSHFRTEMTMEPDGEGTMITMETHVTATTLMAKLMAPMAALMAGTMQQCLKGDLQDLRQRVQSDAEASDEPAV